MTNIIEGITLLGEHTGLVIIGCLELLAALFLVLSFFRKKKGSRNPVDSQNHRKEEKIFLQENGVDLMIRVHDTGIGSGTLWYFDWGLWQWYCCYCFR